MKRLAVLAVSAIAVAGCGKKSSDGDSSETVAEDLGGAVVAQVEGQGDIARADFDRELVHAANVQDLDAVPAEDSPKYERVSEEALNAVLDAVWIRGEAEESGIEVTNAEVRREFEQTKSDNFKTEAEYRKFLTDEGFTQAEIDQRVELQLLSQRIQEAVGEGAGSPEQEQQRFADFLEEYRSKWRERTICAPELATDRCANGPEPEETPPLPVPE